MQRRQDGVADQAGRERQHGDLARVAWLETHVEKASVRPGIEQLGGHAPGGVGAPMIMKAACAAAMGSLASSS